MKRSHYLPEYVTLDKRKGYVHRPYLGRINGKVKWGKRTRLAPSEASIEEVWDAYNELAGIAPDTGTLNWLFFQYFQGKKFQRLADRTKADYRSYARQLGNKALPNGRLLGTMSLPSIKRVTVRGYLDTATAPVQANRQVTFLGTAWNWAAEHLDLPPNPTIGITKNEEGPRDRYVADADYDLALSLVPEWLQIAMELAYWCRARRAEVLAFTYEDRRRGGGLFVARKKLSLSETTVADRVGELIEQSMALPRSEGCNHIVRNRKGKPLTKGAFDSAWRRLAKKMGEVSHFHYHDLKAKGISDMEDGWAGHKSKKAQAVYERRERVVVPQYRSE